MGEPFNTEDHAKQAKAICAYLCVPNEQAKAICTYLPPMAGRASTTGGPLPVQQASGTCSNLGAVRQFEVFGAGECEMLHCEASHTDSGFDKV